MPLEISHLETVQSLISSNSCYLIHKKTSAYLQKFPGYQLAVASASCSLSFHHQLGETLKESRNPCSLHPRAIVWKIESFIDIKFLSKEWDYTKRNRLSWKLVWPQVHLRARAGPVKVKFWHATRHWDSNMDINKMTTNNLTCVEILTVMWGAWHEKFTGEIPNPPYTPSTGSHWITSCTSSRSYLSCLETHSFKCSPCYVCFVCKLSQSYDNPTQKKPSRIRMETIYILSLHQGVEGCHCGV